MFTTDGECSTGLSIGPICNSMARVSRNSSASGISFHLKRGAPMSTVNSPSAPFQQLRMPAVVSKVSAFLPLSFGDHVGDAAHAVAAGAGFRAVVVVDADEGVGAGRARRIERHQLVVGRACGRRRRARLLGRDRCRDARADRPRRSRCRCRSSSRKTGWRARPHHPPMNSAKRRLLPGFRPVYMANKRRLARGRARMAANRRDRRTSTDGEPSMSCLRLAAPVMLAVALALAAGPALGADAPPPRRPPTATWTRRRRCSRATPSARK